MDIWGNYKSKLGYLAGDSKIDTYGVDHSKFSLRDEIAYQMARSERERQLIKNLNSQGITKDYPQYGTNFWGGNADNNYGFGSSDISENIENVTNSLKNKGFSLDQNTGAIAVVPQQKQTLAQPNTTAIGQNNALGQQNNALGQQNNALSLQNQNAENIAKLYSIPSLQNNSALKPLDNTNSYTTESAWSYPNKTSAPFYEKITQSIENNILENELNINHLPYIFSKKMRTLLGQKESENDYKKINSSGGGFGAIGKYQIRRDGFKDTGYINNKNQWTGKNNIYSIADFLNNPDIQEKFLDEYFQAKYRQLQSNGSFKYLGYPFKGIINNFDITDTGLLAASHREGAGAVHNFLSHLEKDANGRYYLDYDAMQDLKQRDIFKHIETRLREFEK